jgi:hypothetical protein
VDGLSWQVSARPLSVLLQFMLSRNCSRLNVLPYQFDNRFIPSILPVFDAVVAPKPSVPFVDSADYSLFPDLLRIKTDDSESTSDLVEPIPR